MITVDGCGRLIDLDLARDRDDIGARQCVRTVSCDVRKGSWASRQLTPLCYRAHGNSCRLSYSLSLERSTNYAMI